MDLKDKIHLLSNIGDDFLSISNESYDNTFPGFDNIYNHNPWFTKEFVKFALTQWSEQLNAENLNSWLENYNNTSFNSTKKLTLGLVMAGNIPMVGFHDLICGFVSGVKINVKLSSKDKLLMKWIIEKFYSYAPELKEQISYTEEKLVGYDVVIATGSNNTNRYFEYYFSKYPHILRKNRNSAAILNGYETKSDLENLADDIFLYFGLGCRNISKMYVPRGYDFNEMGRAFHKYYHLIDHYKYANNFDYQYALIAMNQVERVNFENLLLIERKDFFSPIAIVNFEYYDDIEIVKNDLSLNKDKIQCIVCKDQLSKEYSKFGESQKPKISDYADNIDTLSFLLNLKK